MICAMSISKQSCSHLKFNTSKISPGTMKKIGKVFSIPGCGTFVQNSTYKKFLTFSLQLLILLLSKYLLTLQGYFLSFVGAWKNERHCYSIVLPSLYETEMFFWTPDVGTFVENSLFTKKTFSEILFID